LVSVSSAVAVLIWRVVVEIEGVLLVFLDAKQVLLLLEETTEEAEAEAEEKDDVRGAKAVVEAEAARSNQDEKCRNFML